MLALPLPEAVQAVFENFLCCEFATLGKDGTPLAWPLVAIYWPEQGKFLLSSPVALGQKAANIRRDARVSLLYSEPTGSGLSQPPRVLVQGLAEVSDELLVGSQYSDPQLIEVMHRSAAKLTEKQPGMKMYVRNGLTRRLMGWYFIRQLMTVTPLRITWWEDAGLNAAPQVLEVSHVG